MNLKTMAARKRCSHFCLPDFNAKKKNVKMNYEEESWEPYDDNEEDLNDIEDNFNIC